MQTRWPRLLEPVPVSLDAFFSRRIPDAEAWDPWSLGVIKYPTGAEQCGRRHGPGRVRRGE